MSWRFQSGEFHATRAFGTREEWLIPVHTDSGSVVIVAYDAIDREVARVNGELPARVVCDLAEFLMRMDVAA